MIKYILILPGVTILTLLMMAATCRSQELKRLNVSAELNVGESKFIELTNGQKVNLLLKAIVLDRDKVREAVRDAKITLEVDGEEVVIGSGNYHLPVTVGKVQIDCPVIKEFTVSNYYRLDGPLPKDARFRLWPKDSPLIQPGTFGLPLKQVWLAGRMQSQNEMAGLGWAENLTATNHGYHAPHDFGGAEGLDEIYAATDGLVVSSNKEVLEGYDNIPGDVRPDVVWIMDGRGWYYRYSHLNSIETEIVPGARVRMGQKLGYMGKQGGVAAGCIFILVCIIKIRLLRSGKWRMPMPIFGKHTGKNINQKFWQWHVRD